VGNVRNLKDQTTFLPKFPSHLWRYSELIQTSTTLFGKSGSTGIKTHLELIESSTILWI
jgi:hypothetical protein